MAGKPGRSGGKRDGAGRKPADPVYADAASLQTKKPVQFLEALIADPLIDLKIRLDAAKALLSAELRRAENGGKKEAKAAEAKKAASGKFSASAPPKLVAVKK